MSAHYQAERSHLWRVSCELRICARAFGLKFGLHFALLSYLAERLPARECDLGDISSVDEPIAS